MKHLLLEEGKHDELPSEDPDVENKLLDKLDPEQGDFDRDFLEDPGVEDVIETSRDAENNNLDVDPLC